MKEEIDEEHRAEFERLKKKFQDIASAHGVELNPTALIKAFLASIERMKHEPFPELKETKPPES